MVLNVRKNRKAYQGRYCCKQYMWSPYNKTVVSELFILIEFRLRDHAKGKKRRRKQKQINDYKFGTFISGFPSDGAGSLAVKGLRL